MKSGMRMSGHSLAHPIFVTGSLALTLAMLACGISFFGPYWLENVTTPRPDKNQIESDDSYILDHSTDTQPRTYSSRGLWAQCGDRCQWFWESSQTLQKNKFTKLSWHLATQILYFVGAFLVLFCEIFARIQICCRPRKSIYRSLGFILLSSFVIQAAAVAVFGGFANRDYGATPYQTSYTYLGWCFWMTVAGGGMTLLAGILFLFMDCTHFEYYES